MQSENTLTLKVSLALSYFGVPAWSRHNKCHVLATLWKREIMSRITTVLCSAFSFCIKQYSQCVQKQAALFYAIQTSVDKWIYTLEGCDKLGPDILHITFLVSFFFFCFKLSKHCIGYNLGWVPVLSLSTTSPIINLNGTKIHFSKQERHMLRK